MIMYFANYSVHKQTAPHRTTECAVKYKLSEAKTLVNTGDGYIVRRENNLNKIVYKTPGFEPTAQESLAIESILKE